MHMLDIILALVLVLFFVNGYRKGLVASILQLAGIILAFVLIGRYAPLVKLGLMTKWHLGPILATICSYLLIFVLIAIIIQLVRMGMEHLLKMMSMNFINRILGAMLGALGCLFLFAVLLILIDLLPFSSSFSRVTADSKVVKTARLMKGELLGAVHQQKMLPIKQKK